MTQKLKQIVSMQVGEDKITLYTTLGEVLNLTHDGPHDCKGIAEFLTPQLTGGNIVEIDLSEYLTINSALPPEYEETGQIITTIVDGKEIQGIFYPRKVEVSVKLEGVEEPVVIPKVENLQRHIIRAAAENSPAVANFLRRLAPVVKDRLHSAEDLMDFIERSEMPLTNDGKIIGYKRVEATGTPGRFVDCHSRKIEQGVGSRVWMDIDGVDPSRNNSCSHGLHVANLGYLRNFHGSNTLVVVVDPADFIAVPHGETTKCRVSSYDIVGVISGSSHNVVCGAEHIEGDVSFETLIKEAVEGRCAAMVETVKVGKKEVLERLPITDDLTPSQPTEVVAESSGKSLETQSKDTGKDIVKMARKTKANAKGVNLWDEAPAEVITAFELLRADTLSKAEIARQCSTSTRTLGRWSDKYDFAGYVNAKAANMTVQQRAKNLYDRWVKGLETLDSLVGFKKARKKGWASLGFNASQEKRIVNAIKAS